jgi:7-cyano-7-deazaguanine reductase
VGGDGSPVSAQHATEWHEIVAMTSVSRAADALACKNAPMPNIKLLETFPTPASSAGAPIVIEHISNEFTSVCPMTGHPDFGSVVLRYQPASSTSTAGSHGCVELKSLKLYYQSFRNEGIYYEAVTARLRDDLVSLLKPDWLQVVTKWNGRGGIASVIAADHGVIPEPYRGRH